MEDWKAYVEKIGAAARTASRQLAALDGATKVDALMKMAAALRRDKAKILAANAQDIEAAVKGDVAGERPRAT